MNATSEQKPEDLFDGVTPGAKRWGIVGLVLFVLGTLLIGVYVTFFQDSDLLVMVGLLALWLVVVGSRVAVTARERELSAFIEVMKWQIAIGAAAAAVIAPIGLDPQGQLNPGFIGPAVLFLVSSGCAALGYALLREADQQIQARSAKQECDEKARLIGEQVAAAVDSRSVAQLEKEVERLRCEVARLDKPWWKRWR